MTSRTREPRSRAPCRARWMRITPLSWTNAGEDRQDVGCERIVLAAGGERPMGAEVVVPWWDDVPDAAAGFVHVAEKARDDVHVEVHHGLPRRHPRVEADVVAVGMQRRVELPADLVDERHQGVLLGQGRVEPGGDVPSREDERVARRDGVAVRRCRRARRRWVASQFAERTLNRRDGTRSTSRPPHRRSERSEPGDDHRGLARPLDRRGTLR